MVEQQDAEDNSEVQEVIKEKIQTYKEWQRSKSNRDKEFYLERKREARRCVAEAKKQAWVERNKNLNTVEGRNKIFRLVSQMKQDKTDILGTNFIKNEEGGIEVESKSVRKVWKSYFHNLQKEENENNLEEDPGIEGPIKTVTSEEVKSLYLCK